MAGAWPTCPSRRRYARLSSAPQYLHVSRSRRGAHKLDMACVNGTSCTFFACHWHIQLRRQPHTIRHGYPNVGHHGDVMQPLTRLNDVDAGFHTRTAPAPYISTSAFTRPCACPGTCARASTSTMRGDHRALLKQQQHFRVCCQVGVVRGTPAAVPPLRFLAFVRCFLRDQPWLFTFWCHNPVSSSQTYAICFRVAGLMDLTLLGRVKQLAVCGRTLRMHFLRVQRLMRAPAAGLVQVLAAVQGIYLPRVQRWSGEKCSATETQIRVPPVRDTSGLLRSLHTYHPRGCLVSFFRPCSQQGRIQTASNNMPAVTVPQGPTLVAASGR